MSAVRKMQLRHVRDMWGWKEEPNGTPLTDYDLIGKLIDYIDILEDHVDAQDRMLATTDQRLKAQEASQQALQEWAAKQDKVKATASTDIQCERCHGDGFWFSWEGPNRLVLSCGQCHGTGRVQIPNSEAALIAAGDHRELLEAATALYKAAKLASDYPSKWVQEEISVALKAIAPILATEGALELAPEKPDFSDTYDGFGPMGPANADITRGVDPSLYDHPPTCDCLSCRGDEPPMENIFNEP